MMKKLLALISTICICLLCCITTPDVDAASYNDRYVKYWNNSSSTRCIDYLEYDYESGYWFKDVQVRVTTSNRKVYFKGAKRYTSKKALINMNQIGFDVNGNLYYITKDYRLWFVENGSRTPQALAYAEYLDFDENNFVVSYKLKKNVSKTNQPVKPANQPGSSTSYQPTPKITESYIQMGYDRSGNLYYITSDYKLYYVEKGSNSIQFLNYAEYLDFDSNSYVVSYKIKRTGNSNSNGNSNNNGSTEPYTSVYNQNGNKVTTYYEYNSYNRQFTEYTHLQASGNYLYVSHMNSWVTSDLYNNQYGFSRNGDIYYITKDYKLWYIQKGSSYAKQLDYAEYLDFDSKNWVVSYKIKNNNNNNNYNGQPYTYWSSSDLVLVQSNGNTQTLNFSNNRLILNGNTIYNGYVRDYGFTKDGVVYITSDSRLVYYQLWSSSQNYIADNVNYFNTDNNGIVTSYNNYSGTYTF